jgi:hypothetical protein
MPVHSATGTLAIGAPAPAGAPAADEMAPPGAVQGGSARGRQRTAGGAAVATAPAKTAQAPKQTRQSTSARRAGKRKARRRLSLVLAGVGLAIAGGVGYELMPSGNSGPDHTISTPTQLGTFRQAPRLAQKMNATQLRDMIARLSKGEATHVVDAVYQDAGGTNGSNGPVILLFIGGNLHGTSPGAFISSFTGKQPGAATTSAGSLGGAAACAPSQSGNPAECAWADGDTFGVVLSPTLDAQALASELRQMRPLVEHIAR